MLKKTCFVPFLDDIAHQKQGPSPIPPMGILLNSNTTEYGWFHLTQRLLVSYGTLFACWFGGNTLSTRRVVEKLRVTSHILQMFRLVMESLTILSDVTFAGFNVDPELEKKVLSARTDECVILTRPKKRDDVSERPKGSVEKKRAAGFLWSI